GELPVLRGALPRIRNAALRWLVHRLEPQVGAAGDRGGVKDDDGADEVDRRGDRALPLLRGAEPGGEGEGGGAAPVRGGRQAERARPPDPRDGPGPGTGRGRVRGPGPGRLLRGLVRPLPAAGADAR